MPENMDHSTPASRYKPGERVAVQLPLPLGTAYDYKIPEHLTVAEGDFVDQTVYEGRGAGAGPTASAVAADLVDIARGLNMPPFAVAASDLQDVPTLPMDDHEGPVYVRLMVVDQPGVMADVAAILRDENVSIESVLQRGRSPGEVVPVILILHDAKEGAMKRVLQSLENLEPVVETPRMIRIELL